MSTNNSVTNSKALADEHGPNALHCFYIFGVCQPTSSYHPGVFATTNESRFEPAVLRMVRLSLSASRCRLRSRGKLSLFLSSTSMRLALAAEGNAVNAAEIFTGVTLSTKDCL